MNDAINRYEAELRRLPHEPLGVTRNGGVWPEPRYRFSLVACARWEARYVAEWLSYHRSIGFEHVYLYCNDDDPSELYEAILPFLGGADPFVTFHHYSFQGLQYQMYLHFLRNYGTESEWFSFLDLDEFFCIRGSNSIATFVDGFSAEVDAIYFNWCHYGHNWHEKRPIGSVLTQYTRRELGVSPFTKLLTRARSFPYGSFFLWNDKPVQHDLTQLAQDLVLRNVAGDDYGDYYENFPHKAWDFLNSEDRRRRLAEIAYVAHFNIKSEEDFDLRVRRGLKGEFSVEAMWGERGAAERAQHHQVTNEVLDTYLSDYWRLHLAQSWKHAVFPREMWPLLSDRPSTRASQRSTAHGHAPEVDAANLLTGKLIGRSQAHTDLEDDPSWTLDFGRVVRLHEIRLFNRLDCMPERMARFRIDVTLDGHDWSTWFEKADETLFGGADGTPFCVRDETGTKVSGLRIVVPGPQRFLQLDQVQAFGTDLQEG